MIEPDDREADSSLLHEPPFTHENPSTSRAVLPEAQEHHGIMNDHELLGAYVGGDEKAFETLLEKYFRMVYTTAARQTGDSHLAEEIAQSVFLILSRKARGFSSKISVPGWLLRTTRFVCWDAIKMRRRRDENERKLAMTMEHQPEPTPDPNTVELLLEEAIQALRPEEQAGIVAHFFEGKDFQEIAEMFAITEHAARKRTSRCLAKLQSFMSRRGAKVSMPTLSGLLLRLPPYEVSDQAFEAALQTIHRAWRGKVGAETAFGLADRTIRLLRWRFLGGLSLRLTVCIGVILASLWAWRGWNRPVPARIDQLGKAWATLDQRVAEHRQFLMQTPPNSPNYQAKVQAELAAISRESSRIIGELSPLLALPDARNHLASFLTAELGETLNLDSSQKTSLFTYLQNRLAQGATLKDSMKFIAAGTEPEASEIKAMLSPVQRQLFDKVYGADGVLLFSYPKAVALGQIGP